MTRIRAAVACAAMLGGITSGVVGPAGAEPEAREPSGTTSVSGMGNYCSFLWTDGRWSFAFDADGGDPCATLAEGESGYKIVRSGLYSGSSANNVVVRCQDDAGWVKLRRGSGNDPLQSAFDAAVAANKKHCVFTAAPARMGVFVAPFALDVDYVHATGFDFARPPYGVLDVGQFGQEGGLASVVNNQGEEKSPKRFINNHDALDILLDRGTPIRSVGEGLVVMARLYRTACMESDSALQREVAVQHVVNGENGYQERFVTYYAHLRSIDVQVGQSVGAGKIIGYSGNTGCSSDPHLHFAMLRTTNTSSKRLHTITWGTGRQHNNGARFAIDPSGFPSSTGFDPWAWRAYPDGALSINLWKTGANPRQGAWG